MLLSSAVKLILWLGEMEVSGWSERVSVYVLRPALSCGHGEEREQRPHHVIIVELVSLPLALLHLLPVPPVIDVVASENAQRRNGTTVTLQFVNVFLLIFCSNTQAGINVYTYTEE